MTENNKNLVETPNVKPENEKSVILEPRTETPNPELKAGMNFNENEE